MGTELQNHLIAKKTKAFALFKTPGLLNAIQNRDLDHPSIRNISKLNFYLVCTHNDSIFFWNSNQAVIDSAIINLRDSIGLVTVGQRSFMVCKKWTGKFQCFLLYNAGNSSENSSLPPDHPFFRGGRYIYDISSGSKGFIMKWQNEERIANFNLIDIERKSQAWVLFGILMLFFIGFLVFKFIELANNRGLTVANFIIVSLFCILLRIVLYKRLILFSLLDTELFNPEIYASSFLLPSLGDLILHIICILVIFYCFTRVKRFYIHIPSSKYALFKAILLCVGFTFTTDLVFSIIKSLVVDSNISFHFADLPKINVYSFLGMTVIGIIMGGLFYIFSILFKITGYQHLSRRLIITSITISLIIYASFQYFNGHLATISILTTLIFCLLTLIWFVYDPSVKEFYLNLLLLLVISGFSSFIINYQNKKHEQEYLNVYVNKIVSNQDLEAESKFAGMEQELIKEFITPSGFPGVF